MSRLVAFRVDDELWAAALARARAEGVSVSAVLRAALEQWVHGDDTSVTKTAPPSVPAAPSASSAASMTRACPACGKQRRFVVGRLVCAKCG